MGIELEQEMVSEEVIVEPGIAPVIEPPAEPSQEPTPVISYQSIHINCELVDGVITKVHARVMPSPTIYKVIAIADDVGSPMLFLSTNV